MTKQTILNIMAFMKRVSLTGDEVPAFTECINELNTNYRLLEVAETPENKLHE
jgi:hypothetical protein